MGLKSEEAMGVERDWTVDAAAEVVRQININARKANAFPRSISISINTQRGTCIANATVQMQASSEAPWAQDVREARQAKMERRGY